jgi:hypothetical protein
MGAVGDGTFTSIPDSSGHTHNTAPTRFGEADGISIPAPPLQRARLRSDRFLNAAPALRQTQDGRLLRLGEP